MSWFVVCAIRLLRIVTMKRSEAHMCFSFCLHLHHLQLHFIVTPRVVAICACENNFGCDGFFCEMFHCIIASSHCSIQDWRRMIPVRRTANILFGFFCSYRNKGDYVYMCLAVDFGVRPAMKHRSLRFSFSMLQSLLLRFQYTYARLQVESLKRETKDEIEIEIEFRTWAMRLSVQVPVSLPLPILIYLHCHCTTFLLHSTRKEVVSSAKHHIRHPIYKVGTRIYSA